MVELIVVETRVVAPFGASIDGLFRCLVDLGWTRDAPVWSPPACLSKNDAVRSLTQCLLPWPGFEPGAATDDWRAFKTFSNDLYFGERAWVIH
jgi:hypothetical protein